MYEQPGAPTKLSPERLKIICDQIADGASLRDACAIAEINESTLVRPRST